MKRVWLLLVPLVAFGQTPVVSVDSSGNVTAQGTVSTPWIQGTDTTHTGIWMFVPGPSTNFFKPCPTGIACIFFDINGVLNEISPKGVVGPIAVVGPQGPPGPPGPAGTGGNSPMGAYGYWLPFGRCTWCVDGPAQPANSGYQEQFTPPFNISLGAVNFYVTNWGSSSSMSIVCLYSDALGVPGPLIASSAPFSSANQWPSVPLSASLVVGTSYWLTIAADVAGLGLGVSGSGAGDAILYTGTAKPRTDSGGVYTTGAGTTLVCKPNGVVGGTPVPLIDVALFQNY